MNRALTTILLVLVAAGALTAAKLGEPSPKVELAVLMLRMQMHLDKLHFAGEARNKPLARFYTHEIHETLEAVEQANISEDGVPVSALAPTMIGPALKGVDAAVESGDGFGPAYAGLVAACNSCHALAKHPFIVIRVPEAPMFGNQVFTPR